MHMVFVQCPLHHGAGAVATAVDSMCLYTDLCVLDVYNMPLWLISFPVHRRYQLRLSEVEINIQIHIYDMSPF